jgi:hypothetical protein
MAGMGDGEFSDTGITELIWLTDHDVDYRKLSKNEARYRMPEDPKDKCSNCKHFIAEYSACKRVDGLVEPTFTCDLFEKGPNVSLDPEKLLLSRIVSKHLTKK